MRNSNIKIKDLRNKKIEIIDPPVGVQQECVNVISFCCTSVVPDGFMIESEDDPCIALDFSELECCLETIETTGTVVNPCNGELECPVFIEAVRIVGCARMHANVGPLNPISGMVINEPCSICCDTTTCVNQIIDFTCGQEPPCLDCFEITETTFDLALTTDPCGRQLVVINVQVGVEFQGCP
ncbi:hypothetical protein [Jeotgalibacillus marinus]|uniref:Uncharacterized protein n=1 Tax=Jeotgalibacillus marinus TaxID=86667 RepID=A0ABV3Q6Z8_9BACL